VPILVAALIGGGVLLLTGDSESSALSRARADGTIAAYEQFLRLYPRSTSTAEVMQVLEELSLKSAKGSGTVEGLRAHLDRFSSGTTTARARELLDDTLFEDSRIDATQTANATPLDRYLREFPGGRHRKQAEELAEDIRFEGLSKADERAVRAYLERYPSGRHEKKARRMLDELTGQAEIDDWLAANAETLEKIRRHRPPDLIKMLDRLHEDGETGPIPTRLVLGYAIVAAREHADESDWRPLAIEIEDLADDYAESNVRGKPLVRRVLAETYRLLAKVALDEEGGGKRAVELWERGVSFFGR